MMRIAIALAMASVVAAPFLGRWRAKVWLRENGFIRTSSDVEDVSSAELA